MLIFKALGKGSCEKMSRLERAFFWVSEGMMTSRETVLEESPGGW